MDRIAEYIEKLNISGSLVICFGCNINQVEFQFRNHVYTVYCDVFNKQYYIDFISMPPEYYSGDNKLETENDFFRFLNNDKLSELIGEPI